MRRLLLILYGFILLIGAVYIAGNLLGGGYTLPPQQINGSITSLG